MKTCSTNWRMVGESEEDSWKSILYSLHWMQYIWLSCYQSFAFQSRLVWFREFSDFWCCSIEHEHDFRASLFHFNCALSPDLSFERIMERLFPATVATFSRYGRKRPSSIARSLFGRTMERYFSGELYHDVGPLLHVRWKAVEWKYILLVKTTDTAGTITMFPQKCGNEWWGCRTSALS